MVFEGNVILPRKVSNQELDRCNFKQTMYYWKMCWVGAARISLHFFICLTGKGNRHAVLDSEVVLTKMKLFSNFHERLSIADDSTISTVSFCGQDTTKASELQMKSSSDNISAIFPDSQLPRLYKFESEDSGVELPSGANSPSTPTGSEQSFVVHSRESSCDSCNLKSDPTTLTDKLVTYAQSSEIKQAEDSVDNSTAENTEDNVFLHSEELSSSAVKEELHKGEDVDRDQCKASGISPEGDEEMSGQLEESNTVTERICFNHRRQYGKQFSGACDDLTGNEFKPEPVRRSATSESLEEYMDQCCRLSEVSRQPSLVLLTLSSDGGWWVEKCGGWGAHVESFEKQVLLSIPAGALLPVFKGLMLQNRLHSGLKQHCPHRGWCILRCSVPVPWCPHHMFFVG